MIDLKHFSAATTSGFRAYRLYPGLDGCIPIPQGLGLLAIKQFYSRQARSDMPPPNNAEQLPRFSKLLECCALARREGYRWAWIDTCCIDKTSSAELSEAINSMYTWYTMADVCYAYLDNSKWFKRGWTLQELIAPKNVVFLSRDWKMLGTKRALAHVIEEITGVDAAVLLAVVSARQMSVATRMSWAAGRKTRREEDRAYSLLDHESVVRSYDLRMEWSRHGSQIGGVLAPSPDSFRRWSNTVQPISYAEYVQRYRISDPVPELFVTSYGIRMRLPVRRLQLRTGDTYLAALACSRSLLHNNRRRWATCIVLQHIPGTINQFAKLYSDDNDEGIAFLDSRDTEGFVVQDLYVVQDHMPVTNELEGGHVKRFIYTFFFHWDTDSLAPVGLAPKELWNSRHYESSVPDPKAVCLSIVFREETTGRMFAIIIGVDNMAEEDQMGSNDRILLWSDIITEDESAIWKTSSTANHDEIALRMCQKYHDRSSKWFSSEATIVPRKRGLHAMDTALLASKPFPGPKAESVTLKVIRSLKNTSTACERPYDVYLNVGDSQSQPEQGLVGERSVHAEGGDDDETTGSGVSARWRQRDPLIVCCGAPSSNSVASHSGSAFGIMATTTTTAAGLTRRAP
ncbi:hypothetical protein A0H81_10369 [Grifola frondosa]|uniref:Uncharacterized protein n=1 Tax=Grifola frondosa TaxID=5627 RepID=A0A1C7M3J7_GRIFR|nr:hypothetical protein A0H81_10369 [Grifola frondosa]